METLYAICLGVGLSACCGFRVFLPLFITSTLSYFGKIDIVPGFDWMNTLPTVIAFGVASAVELLAYYIPFVDHILDVLATPLSMAAGTLLSASFLTDIPPLLQWGLGLIVGGGAAGTVQLGTTMARLTSTGITAGLGNFVVATVENILAVIVSILAFFVPVLIAILFFLFIIWLLRKGFTGSKPTTTSF
jgi:hypothetical protein